MPRLDFVKGGNKFQGGGAVKNPGAADHPLVPAMLYFVFILHQSGDVSTCSLAFEGVDCRGSQRGIVWFWNNQILRRVACRLVRLKDSS